MGEMTSEHIAQAPHSLRGPITIRMTNLKKGVKHTWHNQEPHGMMI
jgi:hypothetical protein